MIVHSEELLEVQVQELLDLLSRMNEGEIANLLKWLQKAKEGENSRENLTLKNVVLSQYPSISAFAKAIGWTKDKAYKTINHERQASQTDMEQFIAHFRLSPNSVAPLFFGTMYQ